MTTTNQGDQSMTPRPLILAAALTVAPTVTACLPGPTAPKPVLPPCGPYSLVHEGKLTCIQGPGDRVDYIMAGPVTPSTPATIRNAAVARCVNNLIGAAYWLDRIAGNVASRVLACRTAS
jgi:hypothetical protein